MFQKYKRTPKYVSVLSHAIYVWYIYLYLVDFYGEIYHICMLRVSISKMNHFGLIVGFLILPHALYMHDMTLLNGTHLQDMVDFR